MAHPSTRLFYLSHKPGPILDAVSSRQGGQPQTRFSPCRRAAYFFAQKSGEELIHESGT
jgi:hypothetical protein